jgi:DNA-directed RNA polymerase subunit RPC12/RpoP
MKKKTIKMSYKYCEYCGSKLIEKPRENMFDKFTGKQLLWVQCPKYGDNKHSRWVKELVINIEV